MIINSMNKKELSSYESLLTIEVMVYFCFIVITTCYRSIIQCREHIASYVAYLCSIVAKAFQHILHRISFHACFCISSTAFSFLILLHTHVYIYLFQHYRKKLKHYSRQIAYLSEVNVQTNVCHFLSLEALSLTYRHLLE